VLRPGQAPRRAPSVTRTRPHWAPAARPPAAGGGPPGWLSCRRDTPPAGWTTHLYYPC